jgi:DNA-binding NarL/FixJ family response regulator
MAIRVVLADDHTVVRDGLRLILEAEGDISVVGDGANGREAVSLVRKLSPNVVIMDIAMPELNGIEATRQICQLQPAPAVVMLSVYSTAAYVYRALKAGARGYLLKESAGKDVVNAVRAAHEGRRYLSEKIANIITDDYLSYRGSSAEKDPLEQLSDREREVLQLVAEGKSSPEIAKAIHLSPKTVETYRYRLMRKLKIESIPELVRFAAAQGLIRSE